MIFGGGVSRQCGINISMKNYSESILSIVNILKTPSDFISAQHSTELKPLPDMFMQHVSLILMMHPNLNTNKSNSLIQNEREINMVNRVPGFGDLNHQVQVLSLQEDLRYL